MQVNDSIHLSELTLPAGVVLVELKHDNDQSVVSIHLPRAAVEETPAAEPAAEGAAAPAADAKKDEKK
jgi:large subunit ribosomal protein L25